MTSPDREPAHASTERSTWGSPTPSGSGDSGQQAPGEGGQPGSHGSDQGQPYGQSYGQGYDQGYGQSYGQAYGQSYGHDQGYGQPYGQSYGQDAGHGQSYGYGGEGQDPYAQGDPYASTQVLPAPAPRRERRRPGWLALGGGLVASAVAASALTAALVRGLDDDGAPAQLAAERSGASTSAPVAPGTSDTTAPDWQAVVSAVAPSVVSVTVTSSSGAGEGSGVLWDDQGRIVTNNHVVGSAAAGGQITVTLADGREFAASIVGTDPATDLAIIKIDNPPSGLVPAVLADSDAVAAGQPVMALGNPLGLAQTATTGIVSAVDRPVTTTQEESSSPFGQQSTPETAVTNAIQTDAAVNPGNSGGALLDAEGRVIGINSSIASLSSSGGQAGSIGLGFAIPSNLVKLIGDQLVADGTADHAWLGVSLSQQDATVTVDGAGRTGAQVEGVTAGTPAADAGLQPQDVVIAVDGDDINGGESLIATIREKAVGATVTLTVVRGGQEQDLEITLGARPAQQ